MTGFKNNMRPSIRTVLRTVEQASSTSLQNQKGIRGVLRLGTALTGAAVALLVAAPAHAQQHAQVLSLRAVQLDLQPAPMRRGAPASIVLPVQDLALAAPRQEAAGRTAGVRAITIASPAPAGARRGTKQASEPTIDLTAVGDVVVDAGDVITTDDDTPGIETRTDGATTISAASIATTGRNSAGVHAYGYGPIAVSTGGVTTGGDNSFGIYVNNNVGGHSGGIDIQAGDVTTSGYGSQGIWATGYAGDTNIKAATVSTSGKYGSAVYGSSYLGNTSIAANSVSATGSGAQGVLAISGGKTDVAVGDVDSTGTGILAIGTSVAVNADSVITREDNATGIYAHSDFAIDNGQAPNKDISVNAGLVQTLGYDSDAIHTVNDALGGLTTIAANTVVTHGDQADGLIAEGKGNISIAVDHMITTGAGAYGIAAVTSSGNIQITAPDVKTLGDQSVGIYAGGAGSITISGGKVSTAGASATGIRATTFAGDISVDAADVRTAGTGAAGVYTINYSQGSTRLDVQNAQTGRDYSNAVSGLGFGDININTGSVATSGFLSIGVLGYSVYGDVNISAGTIRTAGRSAYGIEALTVDPNRLANISVDSITTTGAHATGALALLGGGGNIDIGSVQTTGRNADGVFVEFNRSDEPRDGSPGKTVINVGDVTVSGDGARGVFVVGRGDVELNVASIKTTGTLYTETTHAFFGEGIVLNTAYGVARINSGSISTSGDGASGIVANVSLGSLAVEAASIETSQGHSAGVLAGLMYGSADINVGSIITRGDYSQGIQVTSTGLPYYQAYHTTIAAGSISTSGSSSSGIIAQTMSDLTVTAGTIETKGAYSAGISAVSYLGNVKVETTGVRTTGEASTGIYAATVDGSATINADQVTTSGAGSVGVAGVSIYGDVDIHASNVTVTGGHASAILASSYLGKGNVKVDATNVVGSAYGNAIQAYGNAVEISTHGTIQKAGTYAAISATALEGGVVIHNDAAITTTDSGIYGSSINHGIRASALGAVTIDGIGTISTDGNAAYGIAAYSNRGNAISITQGQISTHGQSSHGVVAISSNGVGYAASDGPGGITLNLASVSTSGEGSAGLLLSDNTKTGSVLASVSGDITTVGALATGASLFSANSSSEAHLHGVATSGLYSQAVHLDGHRDVLTVTGPITTSGAISTAIVAYAGNGGIQISASGPVTTTGQYFSSGIRASSAGDIAIAATGAISTSGRGSAGIEVTEGKRHSEVYPYEPSASAAADGFGALPDGSRLPETAATGSHIVLNAASVSTTGVNADGIMASTTTGSVDLVTGKVSVSGAGSIGIFAEGRQLSATVGDTSSAAASAIVLAAFDSSKLNVNGAVKGGADGVRLQGYQVGLTVGSGGSIAGLQNGVTIDATPHVTPIVQYWGYAPASFPGDDRPQPAPPADPKPGAITISNAGTISASSGYAILVSGGAANISNSGTLTSGVHLGGYDDRLTNGGTFVATKDSDFGAGTDVFVNSGTLTVKAAGAPSAVGGTSGTISLLNLEQFENTGGLIDLRGGTLGQTLVLPGTYVGSNGARLAVDLGGVGGPDKLVIGGAATGTTTLLVNASPSSATLLKTPVILVKAGAGTFAGAFELANVSAGLVRYGLSFDSASNSFDLTAEAGAPVYRMLKLQQGARAIWDKSAEAWSTHLATGRDGSGSEGALWGQAYGDVATHGDSRTVDGPGSDPVRYGLGYRQDFFGGQAGADLVNHASDSGLVVLGVSGGYVASHLNFKNTTEKANFDALNAGLYASAAFGTAFVNVLGQYDRYWIGAQDRAGGWSDHLQGNGVGAQLEAGNRFSSGALFAEPTVSVSWQHSSLGDLHALGQTMSFDGNNAMTGRLGLRAGGTFDLGSSVAVFYARGTYVHDFDGKGGLLFQSGGESEKVIGTRAEDHGQAAVGLNIVSSKRISGFVEADGTFGGETKGGGGRIGFRVKL